MKGMIILLWKCKNEVKQEGLSAFKFGYEDFSCLDVDYLFKLQQRMYSVCMYFKCMKDFCCLLLKKSEWIMNVILYSRERNC